MSRGVAVVSATIIGLMLLKDGVFTKLIRDAAQGVTDFGTGVRPITRVA